MRKLQLVNIIIISILSLGSIIGLIALFGEVMQTVKSVIIGTGINDDGLFFGFPFLVVAVFFTVYLRSAIKFYLRKTESNKLIFWACWVDILMMIFIFAGLIFGIVVMASSGEGVYIWILLLPLLPALAMVFAVVSYILFIMGKKKSLNLTNIN